MHAEWPRLTICRSAMVAMLLAGLVLVPAAPALADQRYTGGPGNSEEIEAHQDGLHIWMLPKGGCARDYFVIAKMTPATLATKGTLTECKRMFCTNPELRNRCPELGDVYEVACSGTYESLPSPSGALRFSVQYDGEYWSKLDCKWRRNEKKTDEMVILLRAPKPAPGSDDPLGDWLKCLNRNLPYIIVNVDSPMRTKCR